MPRPENLPAVVSTRHGNRPSADCNWRNGRVGAERDELYLELNPGQVITSDDEQAANPEDFWGWGTDPENVWERVYDEPTIQALASVQTASAQTKRNR